MLSKAVTVGRLMEPPDAASSRVTSPCTTYVHLPYSYRHSSPVPTDTDMVLRLNIVLFLFDGTISGEMLPFLPFLVKQPD